MKNSKISKTLKQYRKQNNLSVKDVTLLLRTKEVAVATKTVYGWESGQTQPDANTLLILCTIYGINNVLETFGYAPNQNPTLYLTEVEQRLVMQYRCLPDFQNAIHKLLDLE